MSKTMADEPSAKKDVIKYSKRKGDEQTPSDVTGIVGQNHDQADDSEEYHVYENYGKSVKYAEYIQQERYSKKSNKVITVRENYMYSMQKRNYFPSARTYRKVRYFGW